ncbi:MAG TPA: hypothetical protein VMT64_09495 [Candidatus Binataceae bacterium]|nr:hypothetical protein [Candidatus Binataceae bacterium]
MAIELITKGYARCPDGRIIGLVVAVVVTDFLRATTPPSFESFHTVRSARFAEVLRGVSWTPDLF